MTSPQVDGARPQRTGAASSGSSSTGSTPRMAAGDLARSRQLAAQFAAQMQQSMAQSLGSLSASEDPEASGGADGAGDDDGGLGLDLGADAAQMELMGSIYAGAAKRGLSAAQLQATLSAMGAAGFDLQGLGSAATSAGAGTEAKLAQQLLQGIGATGVGAATGSAATGSAGGAVSTDVGAASNARVVADVARSQGVDPVVAVAMMLVESGGRNTAVGDGGTSFGLFQLHEGGMLTAAGLTSQQAFDPRTNATVALKSFAHEWAKGHERRTPGQVAAASQRPADPVGYAAKVDASMSRARALLGG